MVFGASDEVLGTIESGVDFEDGRNTAFDNYTGMIHRVNLPCVTKSKELHKRLTQLMYTVLRDQGFRIAPGKTMVCLRGLG